MAASKRTTFSGGSPMAQLANQAAVLENGDSDVIETPVRVTPEHGPVKAAWERFKGYMAGLVAALITTLYTVRALLWVAQCMRLTLPNWPCLACQDCIESLHCADAQVNLIKTDS